MSGLLFLLLLLSWYSRSRTVANLYFADEYVGNMEREELARIVNAKIDAFEKGGIVLKVSGEEEGAVKLLTDFPKLGIVLDRESSVNKIFSVGRSGNWAFDLFVKLQMLFDQDEIVPIWHVDSSLFSSEISGLLSGRIEPPRDATIAFSGQWEIIGEEPGQKLDTASLTANLRSRIGNLSSEPIDVELVETEPMVAASGAKMALEKIKMLAGQRIVLSFATDRWQLAGQNLLEIVEFSPQGLTGGYVARVEVLGEPVEIKSWRTAKWRPYELNLTLNGSGLDNFIDKIAHSIDQDTVDATISFDGERVTQFTAARDGQKLDRTLTREAILEKVSIDNLTSEKNITINLPVEVRRAQIANQEINSLGIAELIGRGVSYFAGSIPNRIHNLTLGSKRISGTIVKPGETFSFNRNVGEILAATGYKQAYVISSGRTVLDDGGGICQVSTTIFRAALNAGLPIVSRTAHAYRVGYYEQGRFGAGYDATVWAPAVDLVFKNDTEQHILIQAVVDTYDAKLQVDIYGTGDGRVVDLGTPVLSNIKPAPEARYQDDPDLPGGTVKQVDFAAQGATSVFGRKVYKDSKLVIDETFKSVYRPWQAVYLVGTN